MRCQHPSSRSSVTAGVKPHNTLSRRGGLCRERAGMKVCCCDRCLSFFRESHLKSICHCQMSASVHGFNTSIKQDLTSLEANPVSIHVLVMEFKRAFCSLKHRVSDFGVLWIRDYEEKLIFRGRKETSSHSPNNRNVPECTAATRQRHKLHWAAWTLWLSSNPIMYHSGICSSEERLVVSLSVTVRWCWRALFK